MLIIDLEAQVLMKLSVRYRHLRRALDVCLPRLLRENSFMVPVRIVSSSFSLLSFLFLSFALAYIFAWRFEWSKKIILYTCWMAWIQIHTHTCDCLYVCVCSLANSFDSACRLRLAGIMTFFLAVVAAFICCCCCCCTVPARSSRTPWPWLRGDLCKFVRTKIHFFELPKGKSNFWVVKISGSKAEGVELSKNK